MQARAACEHGVFARRGGTGKDQQEYDGLHRAYSYYDARTGPSVQAVSPAAWRQQLVSAKFADLDQGKEGGVIAGSGPLNVRI